jgi:hypothetical protein
MNTNNSREAKYVRNTNIRGDINSRRGGRNSRETIQQDSGTSKTVRTVAT